MQQGYNPNQQPKETKKLPKKKAKERKIWLYALIVAAVVLMLYALGPDSETAKPVQPAPATASKSTELSDSVVGLIKTVIAAAEPSFYEVDGDSTAVCVKMAFDGLAADLYAIQQTNSQETRQIWQETKNNFVSMHSGMKKLLDTVGMQEAFVEIDIVNDTNHDNVLLMIMNGSVVYDFLAQ